MNNNTDPTINFGCDSHEVRDLTNVPILLPQTLVEKLIEYSGYPEQLRAIFQRSMREDPEAVPGDRVIVHLEDLTIINLLTLYGLFSDLYSEKTSEIIYREPTSEVTDQDQDHVVVDLWGQELKRLEWIISDRIVSEELVDLFIEFIRVEMINQINQSDQSLPGSNYFNAIEGLVTIVGSRIGPKYLIGLGSEHDPILGFWLGIVLGVQVNEIAQLVSIDEPFTEAEMDLRAERNPVDTAVLEYVYECPELGSLPSYFLYDLIAISLNPTRYPDMNLRLIGRIINERDDMLVSLVELVHSKILETVDRKSKLTNEYALFLLSILMYHGDDDDRCNLINDLIDRYRNKPLKGNCSVYANSLVDILQHLDRQGIEWYKIYSIESIRLMYKLFKYLPEDVREIIFNTQLLDTLGRLYGYDEVSLEM